MSRYLQKISLLPYSAEEMWTGWELEGRSGEIDGLLLVDDLIDADIAARYGVTEFQHIPVEYLQTGEFRSKA